MISSVWVGGADAPESLAVSRREKDGNAVVELYDFDGTCATKQSSCPVPTEITVLGGWAEAGRIIGGCTDGGLCIWDFAAVKRSGKDGEPLLSSVRKHKSGITALDVAVGTSAGKPLLATGSAESEMFVWDLNRPDMALIPGPTTGEADVISGLAWNIHAPHILAATGPLKQTELWDLRQAKPTFFFRDSSGRMRCSGVCWDSASGGVQLLVSSDSPNYPAVQLWDCRMSTKPVSETIVHKTGVSGLAVNSGAVYTAGLDGRCCRIPLQVVAAPDQQPGQAATHCLGGAGSETVLVDAPERSFRDVALGNGDRFAACCATTGAVYLGTLGQSLVTCPADMSIGAVVRVAGASSGPSGKAPPPEATIETPVEPAVLAPLSPISKEPQPEARQRIDTQDSLAAPSRRQETDAMTGGGAAAVSDSHLKETAADLNNLMLERDPKEAIHLIARICGRWAQVSESATEKTEWQLLNAVPLERPRALMLKILNGDSSNAASPDASACTASTSRSALNSVGCAELARLLTMGNINDAVRLCEQTEQFAFALILGAAAGPERFAQVCDAYLDREESPASAIVGAVSRQDWNDRMVEEWPLHDWRAVLSCVIAYAAGDDEFVQLCEDLGSRLETEQEEYNSDASICYICGGSVEAAFSAWVAKRSVGRSGTHEARVEVFSIVSKVTVLLKAMAFRRDDNSVQVDTALGEIVDEFVEALTAIDAPQFSNNAVEFLQNFGNMKQQQQEESEDDFGFDEPVLAPVPANAHREQPASSTGEGSQQQDPAPRGPQDTFATRPSDLPVPVHREEPARQPAQQPMYNHSSQNIATPPTSQYPPAAAMASQHVATPPAQQYPPAAQYPGANAAPARYPATPPTTQQPSGQYQPQHAAPATSQPYQHVATPARTQGSSKYGPGKQWAEPPKLNPTRLKKKSNVYVAPAITNPLGGAAAPAQGSGQPFAPQALAASSSAPTQPAHVGGGPGNPSQNWPAQGAPPSSGAPMTATAGPPTSSTQPQAPTQQQGPPAVPTPQIATPAAPPPIPQQYDDIVQGINGIVGECVAVNNATYKRKLDDIRKRADALFTKMAQQEIDTDFENGLRNMTRALQARDVATATAWHKFLITGPQSETHGAILIGIKMLISVSNVLLT